MNLVDDLRRSSTVANASGRMIERDNHSPTRPTSLPERNDASMAVATPVLRPYRFSRAEYYAIADHLNPARRYELLDGTIYAMSPASPMPASSTFS